MQRPIPVRPRESGDPVLWPSTGFPEFTNEVQHLPKGVLPWGGERLRLAVASALPQFAAKQ